MPLAMGPVDVGARRIGLVVVDEINGFATVGAGNLVPPVESPQVAAMVCETNRLAFLDTHAPGKAGPPYPPHCEAGAGEENLVPELAYLEDDGNGTLLRKDCINEFIGATRPDGSNALVDWVN